MNQSFRRAAVGIPGFCAFLNLYGPQSLLPLLAQEFSATPAEISLTMTATALAIAVTAPFAGAIADMLGRKRVIVAAMLLLTIPTVMISQAPSLPALIFWRFAQGLVLPPIFTVVVAYIGEEWPPSEATGVTGLYMAATSIGGFSGRFFSGLLADTIGWRNGFVAIAAATFLCGLAVAAILPRERNFVRSEGLVRLGAPNARSPAKSAPARGLRGRLRHAVQLRRAVHLYRLRTRRPAVQSAADPARRDLRHLSGWRLRACCGSAARSRASGRARSSSAHRGMDVRRAPDARPFALDDHHRARGRGRLRLHHPGDVDRVGGAHGGKRPHLRDRALRHDAFMWAAASARFCPALTWNAGGWPACVAMVIAMQVFMATVIAFAWKR